MSVSLLGISQNSEDISQALETFRMIKSRIRRDSRQFVFMIYGTAFLIFTTITLSFNKMCIKNISKAFFQLSNMRLIFSICHEIEKLNYYSSTPLPTISSGLWAELLKTSLTSSQSRGIPRSINQETCEERMNRNNIWVAGPETINKTNINGKRGDERSALIPHNDLGSYTILDNSMAQAERDPIKIKPLIFSFLFASSIFCLSIKFCNKWTHDFTFLRQTFLISPKFFQLSVVINQKKNGKIRTNSEV